MQTPVKNKIPMQSRLQICDLGLAGYREVLQLQHKLREQIKQGKNTNTVLLAEHFPVITFGARENLNMLVVDRAELSNRGIELVRTRRGGGVTAHNPGQLVVYPVLKLADYGLGISEYVRQLEAVGAQLLDELGLECSREKGYPGLWVGDEKIASVGVRLSRGVSFHGMAINIRNDLSIFDLIEPCGLRGVEITSVYNETGLSLSMSEVKHILNQVLIRQFGFKEIQYAFGKTAGGTPFRKKMRNGNPAQAAELAQKKAACR